MLKLYSLLFGLFCTVYSQSVVTENEDGTGGSIKFSTPTLSDEDAHSPWMPDMLKCDACRIIAYQLYTVFDNYNQRRKSLKYELPESDVLDLIDSVCAETKAFDSYGIKEVKKVKRLSGPGLETSDVPGVMQGGGKWPVRLRDMCEQYIGEIGEMEMYNIYKKNPRSRGKLENFLCRGKALRGECSRAEAAEQDALKKKKKEEL